MEPNVIYQDEYLLVVDKPAGWITNASGTTTTQPVVQQWLYDNFDYPISKSEVERSGIVHRLDKETSGVLVVAKTQDVFFELQRQFKERLTQKAYIALAHGEIKELDGEITESVGRLPWRRDRFGVLQGGRDATTKYKVEKVLENGKEKYTLVNLFPKTGRTHQIRIHLKHIGHPIVADSFYAGRKTSKKDRAWCPRLFLHAAKLSIIHPETKERIEFESSLPMDLKKVLQNLT